jgi:16S rRNA (cytosine967-C5)-methyltransferase
VPCTGSGTWSRTPEWLRYFDLQQMMTYADLQYEIIQTVLPSLKKDGYLLYATCSVFKEENEEQVAKISQYFGLRIVASELFKGYEHKADTMYGALMQKI